MPRFEVTTHPQFSAAELAVQLAESLQSSINLQEDVRVYQEQIRTDKRKIMELKVLIDQATAFRANPPPKVSRMEPLMRYDLEAMAEEIAGLEGQIARWEEMILENGREIKRHQQNTVRLQKEIAEQNKQG